MTIRVLIVEDEDDIAALLARFLEQSGLVVDRASDGDAGVEAFKRGSHDVVLIDGLLPKRNGFAVAEAIRTMPGGQKAGLIMMSAAFRSATSRRDALNKGFDAFFAKPFIVAELFEEVLKLAEQRAGKPRPTKDEIKAARLKIALAAREAQQAGAEAPAMGQRPAASPSVPSAVPSGMPPPAQAASPSAGAPGSSPPPAAPAVRPAASARPLAAAAKGARRAEAAQRAPASKAVVVTGPETAPFALLGAAREGRSGLVRFSDGTGVLEIAMLQGIPVGAWDNLRENRFGERLLRAGVLTEEDLQQIDARMRSTQERFAEAAVGMGLLDETAALEAIDAQARERLQRAILWSSGEISVHDDEGAVERLYSAPMDLVEAILRTFLEHPEEGLFDRLRRDLAGAPLEATRDYESGLIPFSRLRPTSALPGQFFAGPRNLDEVARSLPGSGAEMVALRFAGLLRAPKDPPADRPIPHDLKLAGAGSVVDAEATKRVRGALLRARGRSFYEMLGVPADADESAIEGALTAFEQRFGREALPADRLGPARDAARELWARIDDARATLLERGRRAAYDEGLGMPTGAPQAASPGERAFLEGRLALGRKMFKEAAHAFGVAAERTPDDVEYLAFLGWATLLAGEKPRERGLALLHSARDLNPQAMRPLFFLALAAAQEGDRPRARDLLTQAARRAPDDRDVLTALDAVTRQA